MTPRIDRYDFARGLLAAGAGASVRALLSDLRTTEANDLREASTRASLGAHVFALTVLPSGRGIALPIRTVVGMPRARDPEVRQACEWGCELARRMARRHSAVALPDLRLEGDDALAIEGPSLALPFALACVFRYAGIPCPPILATGTLRPDGTLGQVAGLDEKLRAAAAEIGAAFIVVPAENGYEHATDEGPPSGRSPTLVRAASFEEAVSALLAGGARVGGEFSSIETMRSEALGLPHALAVESLLALRQSVPFHADKLRLSVDIAARLRHLGRSDEAADRSAEVLSLLATVDAPRIGASLRAQLELHYWLGRMDQFSLDDSIDRLGEMASSGLSEPLDEIRVRGALAQAHGMRGDREAAYRIRLANLPLHGVSEECANLLGGTLNVLALDAARLGDGHAFDAHLASISRLAKLDTASARHAATSFVRGSVALGRHANVVAWFDSGGSRNVPVPDRIVDALADRAPVVDHPEASLVRALVRALARQGRLQDAVALAARVEPEPGTLRGWLGRLVRLEVLCQRAACGDLHLADEMASVRAAMRTDHPSASRFHGALFEPGAHHPMTPDDIRGLETAIDAVWY